MSEIPTSKVPISNRLACDMASFHNQTHSLNSCKTKLNSLQQQTPNGLFAPFFVGFCHTNSSKPPPITASDTIPNQILYSNKPASYMAQAQIHFFSILLCNVNLLKLQPTICQRYVCSEMAFSSVLPSFWELRSTKFQSVIFQPNLREANFLQPAKTSNNNILAIHARTQIPHGNKLILKWHSLPFYHPSR